jgi:hypothetical protein
MSYLATNPQEIGYILLFASLPIAARILAPLVNLMKHPSNPIKGYILLGNLVWQH